MKTIIFFALIHFLTHVSFGQSNFKYNLDKPILKHQLPEILNEISGLTDIDHSRVACVQDELGIVFIYNFRNGEIVSLHRFDSIGDFEGLTFTKNALYILRSDGRLTEWENFPENKTKFKHSNLQLLTSNNEGLCFDPKHNRILIAAKSKPQNHDEKSKRFIYAYDLENKQLQKEPLYSLDVEELSRNKTHFNIQHTITNAKGESRPFNFRPSSLSVHPKTDDIYVISAADRMLLIMNRKGEVLHMQSLLPEMFTKAEGITFLDDGTMIITNEAAGKTPTLFVFEMK